jgi:hypothetical protein
MEVMSQCLNWSRVSRKPLFRVTLNAWKSPSFALGSMKFARAIQMFGEKKRDLVSRRVGLAGYIEKRGIADSSMPPNFSCLTCLDHDFGVL